MFPLIRSCRSVFIGMTVLGCLISVQLDHALAALVDTQASISEHDPDQFRARFIYLLAREDVRVALLRHGTNPIEVEAQIAAMTDQEISQICDRIGELPTGAGSMAVIPLWLALIILLGYVLVLTGVISLGAYAGTKITEQQEEEYAKSTPFLAPPRVGLVPSVNPNGPWTGRWKVSHGRYPGIWSLTQNGDTVISTADSDYKLEAKIYGAMIRGKWSTKGGTDRDFQATIAEDGLSFNGAADYTALRDYFTAKKIE